MCVCLCVCVCVCVREREREREGERGQRVDMNRYRQTKTMRERRETGRRKEEGRKYCKGELTKCYHEIELDDCAFFLVT